MGWFIAKRIAQLLPVLLVASVVLFLVLRIVPGDPARQILGKQATEKQIEQKQEELGLDEPLVEQYWEWASGIPRGDLGETYAASLPVSTLVRDAIPVTLQLAVLALFIAAAVALPMALFSISHPGGRLDTTLTALSVFSIAVPTFVWGLVLVLIFSLTLSVLPSSGYVPLGEDPTGWARSMIMPAIALAMPTIGTLSRVSRAAMLETMDQPYMQFARSKGLSGKRLLAVHCLKASAVPIIAVAGAEFAYILGDAVIVETIFSLPGMGKLMIDSFLDRDYAVIQGVAIVFTIVVVLSALLADIAQAKIDPRIKLERRRA